MTMTSKSCKYMAIWKENYKETLAAIAIFHSCRLVKLFTNHVFAEHFTSVNLLVNYGFWQIESRFQIWHNRDYFERARKPF
jgi:hypothetical protein